jgi:hypothetical protein
VYRLGGREAANDIGTIWNIIYGCETSPIHYQILSWKSLGFYDMIMFAFSNYSSLAFVSGKNDGEHKAYLECI